MSNDLIQALGEIEKERGIPKTALIEAIKVALNTAYKKNFGTAQNVNVELNEITGAVQVFAEKRVVEDVKDARYELSLEDALEQNPNISLEDIVTVEVTPANFGRIAAQTAKQVVIQKLREAERSIIFEEFAEREGEIVTGTVQRIESRIIHINLGRTEAIMMPNDQIPSETYNIGNRIKGYIYEVKNTAKGPNILISRTHPYFLRRLFELEVPEIYEGLVEIKSVSREAGSRSKIAVNSVEDNIDSVGSCVGPKGIRVQNIVTELSGEKIDIIKYDRDPENYIANSLSPSKVLSVTVNEEEKTARVIVPDYQLSLAIGKEGQNARLAARLTGWKVDIKSESQFQEENDFDG
ncbi:Transcription termination protein NusA [Candidatus Syntrophocurvum alkaliphilum]|uniref:Transcription termination/antitermination protein NusA n=1 Tax=Candidatus Syntrophocurvum alkaliphilum TaxID=2293317 RepID=A0A6I6DDT5_9FIRM|nr:transcription termination factor NusA [Candidatus Syntrophocurvum alkaliphilum]QGT99210.1 Transcription termination protein NusA [Candidatus Syntrophocurvum alkaliphilum]